MTKLKKINELIGKAQNLKQKSTGEYLNFQREVQKELKTIRQNRDYSASGKHNLTKSMKQQKTVEFLQGARLYQKHYRDYLEQAQKLAEEIVYAKTPKVADEVMERFRKDFEDVKTQATLITPKRGKKLLLNFFDSIKEPGLLEVVRSEFLEAIQPILNGSSGEDVRDIRKELLQSFEGIKQRMIDPETREAMEVMDYTEKAKNGRFFSPAVETAVGDALGKTAQDYIHQPDKYFELNPEEDKPLSQLKTVEQILAEEAAKG